MKILKNIEHLFQLFASKVILAFWNQKMYANNEDYSLSITCAQTSAPTPNDGNPPSAVIKWLVFMTELIIVSTSIGRIDRRFTT